MTKGAGAPAAIVERLGMKQVSDAGELDAIVDAVLAANPGQVASYRAGKTGLIGYFVGRGHARDEGPGEPRGRQRPARPQAVVANSPCTKDAGPRGRVHGAQLRRDRALAGYGASEAAIDARTWS